MGRRLSPNWYASGSETCVESSPFAWGLIKKKHPTSRHEKQDIRYFKSRIVAINLYVESSAMAASKEMQPENTDRLKSELIAPAVRLVSMKTTGPAMTPESRFGERLSYARKELDLSIEALSRLSKEYDTSGQGVSPTSVSRYESSGGMPGLSEFRILCDALDVPAQWLLFGELANAGKDEAEQGLLASLERYVRAKQTDIEIGGSTVSEYFSWHAQQDRAAVIAKAKKPKG